jgi:hypothetical protein
MQFEFHEDMTARDVAAALAEWAEGQPANAFPVGVEQTAGDWDTDRYGTRQWRIVFLDPDARMEPEMVTAYDYQPPGE